MTTLKYNALVAFIIVACAGMAAGQSAKFAANWMTDDVALYDFWKNSTNEKDNTPANPAAELLATIKSAQGKEFLIGLSGVANLVTLTKAVAKNGRKDDGSTQTAVAAASGSVEVEIKYAPTGAFASASAICAASSGTNSAAPGKVTLSSRKQTLKVTSDLFLTGSTDPTTGCVKVSWPTGADCGSASYCSQCPSPTEPCELCLSGAELIEALELEIDGTIDVSLELDTTAAHHFNFVAYDLTSDVYDIVACFTSTQDDPYLNGDNGGGEAKAFVAIKHRMLTVQQVRAVKDSLVV